MDPLRLAATIVDERLPKLELLRKTLGPDFVLVVISQYVGYLLTKLDASTGRDAITRVATALRESDANIAYMIDKHAANSDGWREIQAVAGIFPLSEGVKAVKTRLTGQVPRQAD